MHAHIEQNCSQGSSWYDIKNIMNFIYLFHQVMVLNKSIPRYQMQKVQQLEQAWQTAMER